MHDDSGDFVLVVSLGLLLLRLSAERALLGLNVSHEEEKSYSRAEAQVQGQARGGRVFLGLALVLKHELLFFPLRGRKSPCG